MLHIPEIFISHASEDKDKFVRGLALYLQNEKLLKVWYDEFVLLPGDSLHDKINGGLRKCRFGIVVLSLKFYAKPWPQVEKKALANLIMHDSQRRLIPVLLDMTPAELRIVDPLLSDCLAIDADDGFKKVGDKICTTMLRHEEEQRWNGNTQYVRQSYNHNYYNPAEEIPKFGYRVEPPYDFIAIEKSLRDYELIMLYLENPTGAGWNSACHITCRERLLDFINDYNELPLYIVDRRKLMGKFDHEF